MTLWHFKAVAPTNDPAAISDTKLGISKELPIWPSLLTDLSLQTEA